MGIKIIKGFPRLYLTSIKGSGLTFIQNFVLNSNDLKCDDNVIFSISEFENLIENRRGGSAHISQTSLALKLTERR